MDRPTAETQREGQQRKGSGGGAYTGVQKAQRRTAAPPSPNGGGPRDPRMWLIAASLVAVPALLVGFLDIDTPQDRQHAHDQASSEAAAERLAARVQQADLEATGVEADTRRSPEDHEALVPAPTVTVTADELPLTVVWREKTRFATTESGDHETTEIDGHTVKVFDAPAEEAPADVQVDCGLTSLVLATVHMHALPDAGDLPPDRGESAVMDTVTALAGTIPCPQDLPLDPDT